MSVQLLRQHAEWVIETSPVPPTVLPAPSSSNIDVFAAVRALQARMEEFKAEAAVASTALEARVEDVRAEAAAATMKAEAQAAAGVAEAKAEAAAATEETSSINNAVVYPLARRCLLDKARTLLRMAAGQKDRELSTAAGVPPKWAKDYLSGQLKQPDDPGEPDERGQPDQGGQAGQPREPVKPSLIMADLDIIFLSPGGSPRGEGNVAAHVFTDKLVEAAVLEASPAVEQHRDNLKRIFVYVYGRDAVERRTSS